MPEDQQTRPSAIVATGIRTKHVAECTVAELATECIRRLDEERRLSAAEAHRRRTAGEPINGIDEAPREFSLAITHLEDAITRANKGNYRVDGRFAITDAERRAL